MRRSLVIGIALGVSIATLGCTPSGSSTATRLLSAANVVAPLALESYESFYPGANLTLGEVSFANDSTLVYTIGGTVAFTEEPSEVQWTFTCSYVIGEQYQLVGARQRTQTSSFGYSTDKEKQLVDGKDSGGLYVCPPSE